MAELSEIDETVGRIMVFISQECGITDKKYRRLIAVKIRRSLLNASEPDAARRMFLEAWEAAGFLMGFVESLSAANSLNGFSDEAEAMKNEIQKIATRAQRIRIRAIACQKI